MRNYLIKTVGATIAGTTVMTLSSALMSLGEQDFREPKHLRRLVGRLLPTLSSETKTLTGWAGHYALGMAFSLIYVMLWEKKLLKPSVGSAILLGLASSVVGIGIWKTTFKLHPFTPFMDYKRFYLQRIPAHLVFAAFATVGYVLTKKYLDNRPSNVAENPTRNKLLR
ncbi:hypothetical protein [Pedobacter sp. BMA]|uniref:hypothetical protein n=1 Tax=Pedobacter sp. BMA TaxID=1663685 RepID=UPI000649E66E|nr:hypothetical protein [Pedobacter sp. BMA]KLT63590.1 hypothetical protein AB669_20970 [Pedobacter sp. BMA]